MEKKMSKKLWFNILLFSLIGQVAWNVENMYFNTFLYNSVYAGASQAAVEGTMPVVTAISRMVALSAITAVVTTFIMGTLSDNLKNRKLFIAGGYVAWGFVTALFGFISRDNIAAVFGLTDEIQILTATVWSVIIMDCIMTFTGSTSNDSAFNAWVTDVTTPAVRPKVEVAFSIIPVLAMGIVMGIGTFAQIGTISYSAFFIGLGVFVILCGVAGFFLLEEPEHKASDEDNTGYSKKPDYGFNSKSIKENTSLYFKSLVYGFNPKVIKENSRLYLALLALCCSSVATQVFFPYILTYLQYVILPASENINYFTPAVITPIIISLVVTIVLLIGLLKLVNKNKKLAMFICVAVFAVTLTCLSFSHNIVSVVVFALPLLPAMFIFSVHMSASIRDFTPVGKAGMFQGVRMIFAVLLPMIIGPALGERACLNSAVEYVNEYGVTQVVPASSMFFYAAIVIAVTFIPLFFLAKKGFEVESAE